MNIDKVFDIFIAFHGDEKSGTKLQAEQIYYFLKSKNYNVFIQSITNSNGAYKDTHRIVQNSKLFLFVVNNNIRTTNSGQINTQTRSGEISNIWEEIDAFRNSSSYRKYPDISSRLYVCDDQNYEKYVKLDSMFNGRICLFKDDYSDVLNWINKSLKEMGNESCGGDKYWNAELAKTWHSISPPSRPSKSEVEVYRKYLKIAKQNSKHAQNKILILGTTNEFRVLANEENFEITIVDSSEEYHKEITTELDQEFVDETVVTCDWLNMSEDSKIRGKKYDIIIGDLAVGNIGPNDLEKFIEQINVLLEDQGFFIGKSIFSFNNVVFTSKNVEDIMIEYFEKDLNYDFFEYSLYPLIYLAADHKGDKKIKFNTIYKTITDFRKRYPNIDNAIFDKYIGEKTSFDKKMKLDFYVYSIKEYLKICLKYFSICDIDYSNDCYSEYFPLFIFEKAKGNGSKRSNSITSIDYKFKKEISIFLVSNKELTEIWTQALTPQYFLANIIASIENGINQKEYKDNILKSISKDIQNSMYIALDENLNCVMDFYYDSKITKETLDKYPNKKINYCLDEIDSRHNFHISEKKDIVESLNDTMINNYILGVLCFLTKDKDNSAKKLSIDKLFSFIEEGEIWKPIESIWVSSRICLSLIPIFSCLNEEQRKKLISVIERIIFSYNKNCHCWTNYDLSSKYDTFSLCLNVIINSWNIINENENIRKQAEFVLEDVLNYYIMNDNIYDTIQDLYVGKSLSNLSKNDSNKCKQINDKISKQSSLLKLTNHFVKYSEDLSTKNEIRESQYILKKYLYKSWLILKNELVEIHSFSEAFESSLVPQIIFSFLDSMSNFQEEINDKQNRNQ